MKKFQITLLIFALAISMGCDSGPSSFEDSIPVYSLETTLIPEGSGSVHPSGGEYSSRDRIEIEAQPAEGFVFLKWDGDITGNINPELLLFDSDKNVRAHFTERDYTLNIEISGEGFIRETVIEAGSDANEDSLSTSGRKVRLEAVAAEDWIFDHWEGDLTGTENPELISVDEEKSITAVFDRSLSNGYTITINTEGEGTVERDPNRDNFVDGDVVLLTALPESGWTFFEWQGDLSGDQPSQEITISDNVEATAIFREFTSPLLNITEQPSTGEAGSRISPYPAVKLTDNLGDPVQEATIHVSLNQHSFNSPSTTEVITDENGIATFDNLIIERASSDYSLSFSTDDSDVQTTHSNSFEIVAAEADPQTSRAEINEEGSVGESVDITIILEDSFGNKVKDAANSLSVEVSGVNSATPSVSEAGDGRYETSYTPSHSGTDLVSVRLNGNQLSDSPYSIDIRAGSPSEIIITQQPGNVTAGSAISSAPAVRVVDGFGNALEDVDVLVRLNENTFSGSSSTTAVTNSSGVAQFSNLIIYTAGSDYALIFQIDDLRTTSNSFDVLAASADMSTSSADVPNGTTGEETTITITLLDRFENAISGAEDDLSVDVRRTNLRNLSVDSSENAGVYFAIYVPVSKGSDQVNAWFNGARLGESPYTSIVSPAEASPFNSSVTASPEVLQSGETSVVTVELRDDYGNPIGGLENVDFNINLDGNASAGSITESSTPGTYSFNISSISVGVVAVSISANGVLLDDSPVITFEPGNPSEMTIVVEPEDSRSGQPIEGPPTVRVTDTYGHNIPGVIVRVRELGGNEFSSGNLEVATNQSGLAVFDDLVIETNIRWFNLVFSVDGIRDEVSDRFRVSSVNRSSGN
ncbi:hypothetical protein DYD21_12745 [Rhodohalobacter sp. SW132]|uniref:InlB B-repeat-containing protein n=1 Tax=Rhodohalobacter sp. SW132 TaxID=2293433 RepID=UPI000E24BE0E|nr:filamin/ABP280 repeat domain-containing protein [Rhodohalobacter sp. SW132]REL33119.1 hypothetical protein DYD21_12745 [Rhodohalobacter sp. SW132]